MIPSIETIVEDLAVGKITKSQAVTWLYAHSEGASNELRDYFAGEALNGMLASDSSVDRTAVKKRVWACAAYDFSDAMLEARKAK